MPEQTSAPVASIKPQSREPKPQRPRTGSPIEQAAAMRDALRVAAVQANDLLRSLKHQRRQSRIVETTLASLKQLQRAAG